MSWATASSSSFPARHWRVLVAAATVAASSFPVRAQSEAAGRPVSFSASLDGVVSEEVDARASTGRTYDNVVQLRPGLRLDSRSGRVVGSLSYNGTFSRHSKPDFQGQNVQNYLSANMQAEVLPSWMYVDGSASVTQQPASLYGQQSVSGSGSDNSNQIEVGSVRLSPYARGVLASLANYELRAFGAATNGRRSIAADSTTAGGSFSLSSAVPASWVTWDVSGSSQTLDFRAGRTTRSDRVGARLGWLADTDLSLHVRGGQESNDILGVSKTRYGNWGGGLTWRPSPRTRFQLDAEERYFGRSHQVLFEYRLPLSSVRFSSVRDATNGADPSGGSQRVTVYQLFDRMLAGSVTDPVQRDAQIRAMLQSLNITDPNQLVPSGAINSAVTLNERNELLLSYIGQRLSGSVQAFTARTSILDSANPGAEPQKQWGWVALASYRLTPTAQINLSGSRLLTASTSTQAGSELKSLNLGVSEQLARRTSLGVNLRYTVFNNAANPYRQASAQLIFGQRF